MDLTEPGMAGRFLLTVGPGGAYSLWRIYPDDSVGAEGASLAGLNRLVDRLEGAPADRVARLLDDLDKERDG